MVFSCTWGMLMWRYIFMKDGCSQSDAFRVVCTMERPANTTVFSLYLTLEGRKEDGCDLRTSVNGDCECLRMHMLAAEPLKMPPVNTPEVRSGTHRLSRVTLCPALPVLLVYCRGLKWIHAGQMNTLIKSFQWRGRRGEVAHFGVLISSSHANWPWVTSGSEKVRWRERKRGWVRGWVGNRKGK